MLNDTICEVMTIVEQIVDGDWLEPLSAGDVSGNESSTDGNTEGHAKASQLITSLLLRGPGSLEWVSCSKIVSEGDVKS